MLKYNFEFPFVVDYLKQCNIENLTLSNDHLNNSMNLSENVLLYKSNLDNSKFILKVLNFNTEQGTFEHERSKNLLKEFRIFRTNDHFFKKPTFFLKDSEKRIIYLGYEYFHHSVASFINGHNLDFNNKLSLMKNLLHELMVYHCKGIISLNLSVNSLRFTPNDFYLTQCSMGNSINMNSEFDIDRNSIVDKSKFDLHTSPEIILNKVDEINWHSDIWSLGIILAMVFSDTILEISIEELENYYSTNKIPDIYYNKIKNIYIKAIIIGILRIDPYERPNIFQIIEIYNKLINHLEMPENYILEYIKSDVLCN